MTEKNKNLIYRCLGKNNSYFNQSYLEFNLVELSKEFSLLDKKLKRSISAYLIFLMTISKIRKDDPDFINNIANKDAWYLFNLTLLTALIDKITKSDGNPSYSCKTCGRPNRNKANFLKVLNCLSDEDKDSIKNRYKAEDGNKSKTFKKVVSDIYQHRTFLAHDLLSSLEDGVIPQDGEIKISKEKIQGMPVFIFGGLNHDDIILYILKSIFIYLGIETNIKVK